MDVDKKISFNPGIIISLIISVIPMFAWKIGYSTAGMESWEVLVLSLAKIGAFGGMAMFALSLILSGRYRLYERLFHGLDKMYITHRFLGSFSLLLLVIHPIALSILHLDEGVTATAALWFKWSDVGILLGAISLYGLLGLILWSVLARPKYETFIKVHRFLGLAFIFGALHAFSTGSIIADNNFVFWYLLVLTLAGTYTFIVYSLLGDILHRPLNYKLLSVRTYHDNIVILELSPQRRIINFSPGQFVYIQFDELAEHGYHPFSISSARHDSTLKLVIRKTGDFTNEITTLKKGSVAKIKGPHGGFILRSSRHHKQLWIAGGIGVTPFLSAAQSLTRAKQAKRTHDIEMIYASDDAKPYGLDELEKIEEITGMFNVTLFDNKTFGYPSFEAIKKHIESFDERQIYICGPPPMLDALRAEAERGGFEDRLHYEEFSY